MAVVMFSPSGLESSAPLVLRYSDQRDIYTTGIPLGLTTESPAKGKHHHGRQIDTL